MRGLAILVLVVALAGCTAATQTTPTHAPTPTQPSLVTVEYRITSNQQTIWADLTYANEQDGTEQVTHERLPWSKQMTMKPGQHAYISAQIEQDHGIIRCDILVNGQPWRHSESDGAYVIATCSGAVGRE